MCFGAENASPLSVCVFDRLSAQELLMVDFSFELSSYILFSPNPYPSGLSDNTQCRLDWFSSTIL